jgi:hypothetical protein
MTERESSGAESELYGPAVESELFTDVRTHPETGTRTATYDHTTESTSVAITELVARCEGCHPCSLPPLYGALDTDSLDDLLTGHDRAVSSVRVSFRYAGYEVVVEPGSLSVTSLQ